MGGGLAAIPLYGLQKSELMSLDNDSKSTFSKKHIWIFILIWIGLFLLHHIDIITLPFFGSYKIFSSKRTIYTSTSTIEFCESVDNNLNCIQKNSVFYRGTVYAKITSDTHFKDDYIYITIYSMNGQSESIFDKGAFEVNPDWNVFTLPIDFEVSGDYKVVARKSNNNKISEGIVSIK